MQSLALLPKLRELPAVEDLDTSGTDGTMALIRDMDRNHFAIEVSQATEEALETLFRARNVPDELNEAYRLAFSSVADDSSLHEQYREMLERGSGSVTGFVSNLKGKVAELKAEAALEERNPGYDSLVKSPVRGHWKREIMGGEGENGEEQVVDVSSTGTAGEPVAVGVSDHAEEGEADAQELGGGVSE